METLWPDLAVEAAAANLRKATHFARRALGWEGSIQSMRPLMHYSAIDRVAGFNQVMRAAGLEPQVLSHERFIETSEHVDVVCEILRQPDRPTAIIAYSENEAYAIACAARMLGLAVPQDLSMVVFAPADLPVLGYEISAAAVPTYEMGRRAVLMLLDKVKAPEHLRAPEAVPYPPMSTATIAPARG